MERDGRYFEKQADSDQHECCRGKDRHLMEQGGFQMQSRRILRRENLAHLTPHDTGLAAQLDRSCQANSRIKYRANIPNVRRSAQTVYQRKTVGQDPGAKRAEKDVFQRRFIRTLFAAQEPGQHVEAERHGLQPEEHHDQVNARGHEHHSDTRKEQKRVVFPLLLLFDVQVFHGQQNHERRGCQEECCEKEKERIDHHRLVKAGKIASGAGRDRTTQLP